MKFVVFRPMWGRGGRNTSMLQINTPEITRCCLGFACHQLGVPEKELVGRLMPSSVGYDSIPDKDALLKRLEETGFIRANLYGDPTWTGAAAETNDGSFSDLLPLEDEESADGWGDPPPLPENFEAQAEAEREKRITDLFSQAGHEIIFTDDPDVYQAHLNEIGIRDESFEARTAARVGA